MVRRLLPAVALAVLLLSGCTAPAGPAPSPTPSADAPLFATEEEAVEAAEAALEEYWKVSDEVFQNGGEGVERLQPLVTESRYADSQVGARDFSDRGWVQIGDITADSVTYQSTYSKDEVQYLVVSTCVDYSNYSLETASGEAIELVEARVRVPFETTFEVEGAGPATLLLDSQEKWDGSC